MNAPLHPNEPPSSSGESAEYFICPTGGRLVVSPKSAMPFAPEQIAAAIAANPDIVACSTWTWVSGD